MSLLSITRQTSPKMSEKASKASERHLSDRHRPHDSFDLKRTSVQHGKGLEPQGARNRLVALS